MLRKRIVFNDGSEGIISKSLISRPLESPPRKKEGVENVAIALFWRHLQIRSESRRKRAEALL